MEAFQLTLQASYCATSSTTPYIMIGLIFCQTITQPLHFLLFLFWLCFKLDFTYILFFLTILLKSYKESTRKKSFFFVIPAPSH